jgi:hypothetical protein
VFYSDDKVYDVEFEDGKMISSKEIKESWKENMQFFVNYNCIYIIDLKPYF